VFSIGWFPLELTMTVAAFPTAFRPRSQDSLAGLFGLFLLLAVVAFFTGFGGYLIFGPPHVLRDTAHPQRMATPAAAVDSAFTPAGADWDPPRQV
jgi:hypothetical protein